MTTIYQFKVDGKWKFCNLLGYQLYTAEGVETCLTDYPSFVQPSIPVRELSTEPRMAHTCPYSCEIDGDCETLCNCSEEAEEQCARAI